jgi:hypothetical protein
LKKYKGNGLMSVLSGEILGALVHFGQIVLDLTILIGYFWLLFLLWFFIEPP